MRSGPHSLGRTRLRTRNSPSCSSHTPGIDRLRNRRSCLDPRMQLSQPRSISMTSVRFDPGTDMDCTEHTTMSQRRPGIFRPGTGGNRHCASRSLQKTSQHGTQSKKSSRFFAESGQCCTRCRCQRLVRGILHCLQQQNCICQQGRRCNSRHRHVCWNTSRRHMQCILLSHLFLQSSRSDMKNSCFGRFWELRRGLICTRS
jgi:hypothetical protein